MAVMVNMCILSEVYLASVDMSVFTVCNLHTIVATREGSTVEAKQS